MIRIRTLSVKQNIGRLTAGAEGFAQQILGNYTLMCLSITAEDMIHLALMPYEIWQEHTHATAILNEDVRIRQEQKAEFVNQLINRLALLQRAGNTYQNQVFIEAALRKLGIRGQKEFLQAVRLSIGVDKAASSLLKTYREKLDVLQEMADKAEKRSRRKKRSQHTAQDRKLYLQDGIFARLDILNIIRELCGLRSEPQDAIIQAKTMKMADLIELSSMRNKICKGKLQSNMERINPYEWGRITQSSAVEETIEGKLSAAVLLSLVTGAAMCAAEKNTGPQVGNRMPWLDILDNFSSGSRDTVERFFMYHKSMHNMSFEMQKSLLETTADGFDKETKILRNIEENTRKTEWIQTLEETWLHSKTIRKIMDSKVEKKLTGLWISGIAETEAHLQKVLQHQADILYVKEQREIWEKAELIKQEEDSGEEMLAAVLKNAVKQEIQEQMMVGKSTLHVEKTNICTEFSEQNIREINRLVKTHIQSQMEVMTDKVYGKMENRLLGERKRRGL